MRLLVDDEPFDVRYGELLGHERVLDLRAGTLRAAGALALPGRARGEGDLDPARVVRPSRRGRPGVRRGGRRRVHPGHGAVRAGGQRGRAGRPRATPAVSARLDQPLEAVQHEHAERSALLLHRTQVQRAAHGRRHGPRGGGPRPGRGRDRRHGRLGPHHRDLRAAARTAPAHREVPVLRLVRPALPPALRDQVAAGLASARYSGWQGLLDGQRQYLDDFWDSADVEVEGDPDLQQAVRFGLFHVLQASARAERRPIAGKGLTGSGLRRPRVLGHRGLRPAGADLHRPAGRGGRVALEGLHAGPGPRPRGAARAAGRDVPLAHHPRRGVLGVLAGRERPPGTSTPTWRRPSSATASSRGTSRSRRECGLAVLVETARLWLSLGHHDRHGVWHVDGATGPDEYTAVVRDNVFTNLMAAHNLRSAADACARSPEAGHHLGVTTEETAAWRDAAEAVHVPYAEELGVHEQCEGFTSLREWDFDGHARALPAAAARAVRPAVSRPGGQAGRPGPRDALAGPRVHRRAEGAQRRLLRARGPCATPRSRRAPRR